MLWLARFEAILAQSPGCVVDGVGHEGLQCFEIDRILADFDFSAIAGPHGSVLGPERPGQHGRNAWVWSWCVSAEMKQHAAGIWPQQMLGDNTENMHVRACTHACMHACMHAYGVHELAGFVGNLVYAFVPATSKSDSVATRTDVIVLLLVAMFALGFCQGVHGFGWVSYHIHSCLYCELA